MKKLLPFIFMLSIAFLASCDLRSEIAKKNMEKYTPSPTPEFAPAPSATPIDPADIVKVDTSQQGDMIPIAGHDQTKTVECKAFNRIMVNGDGNTLTIKGACRQIMINGRENRITVDAAIEIVLNESENTVRYSRYINGQRPSVIDNRGGNLVEKTSADAVTSGKPQRKIDK